MQPALPQPPPLRENPPPDYPPELVGYQSNITRGLGSSSWKNSVGLVIAAVPSRCQRKPVDPGFWFLPGAAVRGHPNRVATALHPINEGIEALTYSPSGQVRVYAMTFAQYQDFFAGASFGAAGAKRATGFHSVLTKMQWTWKMREDFGVSLSWGLDLALVKLKENLVLPPDQPIILSVSEMQRIQEYLRSEDVKDSELHLEVAGMGIYYTEGVEVDGDRQVRWLPVDQEQWMYTETNRARAEKVADSLRDALQSCPEPGCGGIVTLHGLCVPHGFSGGGTYLTVPSKALNPEADPAAQVNVLLGNLVGCICNEDSGKANLITVKLLTQEELQRNMGNFHRLH